MDARVEAERETADEGWPGRRRRGRGRTGRKGRGKAQGTQVERAQGTAASGVAAKKHPPQNFEDASICHVHVTVYDVVSDSVHKACPLC